MNKTAWIILGSIFVVVLGAAGAALAMLLFFEDADNGTQGEPPAKTAPAPSDSPTMDRRIEKLENEIKQLRDDLAAERKKNAK